MLKGMFCRWRRAPRVREAGPPPAIAIRGVVWEDMVSDAVNDGMGYGINSASLVGAGVDILEGHWEPRGQAGEEAPYIYIFAAAPADDLIPANMSAAS